jgi:FAIM1 (Fas apoptotic inhibitory molecule) protein
MQFAFEVGVQEKHRVDFSFDQFTGRLTIWVDGQAVVNELRMLSMSLVKKYEFDVGHAERHHVAIEKKRAVLFAGFRPSNYTVCVDGQIVAKHRG